MSGIPTASDGHAGSGPRGKAGIAIGAGLVVVAVTAAMVGVCVSRGVRSRASLRSAATHHATGEINTTSQGSPMTIHLPTFAHPHEMRAWDDNLDEGADDCLTLRIALTARIERAVSRSFGRVLYTHAARVTRGGDGRGGISQSGTGSTSATLCIDPRSHHYGDLWLAADEESGSVPSKRTSLVLQMTPTPF